MEVGGVRWGENNLLGHSGSEIPMGFYYNS